MEMINHFAQPQLPVQSTSNIFFLSSASSTLSSHGAVSSSKYASLAVVDQRSMSDRSFVIAISGENTRFPHSSSSSEQNASLLRTACVFRCHVVNWRLACWYEMCKVGKSYRRLLRSICGSSPQLQD